MNEPTPAGWRQRVWWALVLLLLIAIGARAIYQIMEPLVPTLTALLVLSVIIWWLFSRRRH